MARGASEAAVKCFEKAVELEPEDPQPYLNLAELCYDDGDLDAAEQWCVKGLKLDASLPSGYLTLGNICLDQDRTQDAVENYQQFLRLERSPSAKQIRDEVAAVIEGLS
jgi:tetratricopeptide (TPR) repeat protein